MHINSTLISVPERLCSVELLKQGQVAHMWRGEHAVGAPTTSSLCAQGLLRECLGLRPSCGGGTDATWAEAEEQGLKASHVWYH